MKVLITDDEKPARDRLRRLISDLDGYEVVAEAANGREALDMVVAESPEIVLMDIRMPMMDGIEAARHIYHFDRPPAVIFTTAYGDHALEAFETHAVDYLLKPVRADRLENALKAAERPNRAQDQGSVLIEAEPQGARRHICARVRGNLTLVPVEDVFFFHAEHKYVSVRHAKGEVLIEEPLKDLETEFGSLLLRVHRNALVAVDKVRGLERGNEGRVNVVFSGIDDRLEISRRHLSNVRKVVKEL